MSPAVLIVTEKCDVTADHVALELEARGTPVFRFDTAEFPLAMEFDARLDLSAHGRIRTARGEVDLGDVESVYYRRPSSYRTDPALGEFDSAWAAREARFGFGGMLAALPRWLNHPAHIARAEYKPVQFAAARAARLRVPPALLTNDASAVRTFAMGVGPIVYTPLSGAAHRHGSGHDAVDARPIGVDELDDPAIAATACLFRQQFPVRYAVRIVEVDGMVFTTCIDTGTADGGTGGDAPSDEWVRTPAQVAAGIRRLMIRLRLRFCAFDFLVTPDDEWVWLGIDPNGWHALAGEPTPEITNVIADALTRRRT